MKTVTGTVVARYKRHCLVAGSSGTRTSCQMQRRTLNPVVGDNVLWHAGEAGTGLLTEVLPRKSELTRIDSRGRPEVVAANLTQLAIVLAGDPAPDWFLVDRYLAAAELSRLKAIVVFNKTDIAKPGEAGLEDYSALGYSTYNTSAVAAAGLHALMDALRNERSAMIGQSGVGKSSLLNALLGDALQTVGELSPKSGQGRHTTSTASLYALPEGGELVDSPGVRDYAPYIADARDVAGGFREVRDLQVQCRFDDCRHLAEPACAVKAGLAGAGVRRARYESYVRLYRLTESLQAGEFS